jgi:integrase
VRVQGLAVFARTLYRAHHPLGEENIQALNLGQVGGKHVGETAIQPIERGILRQVGEVKRAIKPENASGWIFPNTIGGALDLDNLADRVIKPVLKAKELEWKGWQAYRRGLATNLKKLGVPDTVIQAILRHENVSTTQKFYIKTARQDVKDAMKQLERKIQSAAVVQQVTVN